VIAAFLLASEVLEVGHRAGNTVDDAIQRRANRVFAINLVAGLALQVDLCTGFQICSLDPLRDRGNATLDCCGRSGRFCGGGCSGGGCSGGGFSSSRRCGSRRCGSLCRTNRQRILDRLRVPHGHATVRQQPRDHVDAVLIVRQTGKGHRRAGQHCLRIDQILVDGRCSPGLIGGLVRVRIGIPFGHCRAAAKHTIKVRTNRVCAIKVVASGALFEDNATRSDIGTGKARHQSGGPTGCGRRSRSRCRRGRLCGSRGSSGFSSRCRRCGAVGTATVCQKPCNQVDAVSFVRQANKGHLVAWHVSFGVRQVVVHHLGAPDDIRTLVRIRVFEAFDRASCAAKNAVQAWANAILAIEAVASLALQKDFRASFQVGGSNLIGHGRGKRRGDKTCFGGGGLSRRSRRGICGCGSGRGRFRRGHCRRGDCLGRMGHFFACIAKIERIRRPVSQKEHK